jgi:hypothetical protein
MGHYVGQCPLKKKGKGARQVVVGIVASVEDMNSQFETSFSMNSCLCSNTFSNVVWYVDNGALRHMTYDRSLFSRI